MTIADLKKWLDTFPGDTEVYVAVMDLDGTSYEEPISAGSDDPIYFEDDGSLKSSIWGENWDYREFPTGKRVLTLGER